MLIRDIPPLDGALMLAAVAMLVTWVPTLVFSGVAGLLLAVALAATAVPAWRAAQTQPMRVLREE
jgi:ABC-type lipoprotein release transport system permease subunit